MRKEVIYNVLYVMYYMYYMYCNKEVKISRCDFIVRTNEILRIINNFLSFDSFFGKRIYREENDESKIVTIVEIY